MLFWPYTKTFITRHSGVKHFILIILAKFSSRKWELQPFSTDKMLNLTSLFSFLHFLLHSLCFASFSNMEEKKGRGTEERKGENPGEINSCAKRPCDVTDQAPIRATS